MVEPRPRGRPPRPALELDLFQARTRAGLSMRAAAERFGVPLSTWRRWERGDYPPPPADVERIVLGLRTPEDGLELERG